MLNTEKGPSYQRGLLIGGYLYDWWRLPLAAFFVEIIYVEGRSECAVIWVLLLTCGTDKHVLNSCGIEFKQTSVASKETNHTSPSESERGAAVLRLPQLVRGCRSTLISTQWVLFCLFVSPLYRFGLLAWSQSRLSCPVQIYHFGRGKSTKGKKKRRALHSDWVSHLSALDHHQFVSPIQTHKAHHMCN